MAALPTLDVTNGPCPEPLSEARSDPFPDPLVRPGPVSKVEIVFHHVRREILLGLVPRGAQLLEQKIAAAAVCSQGTAREALMRLEREGLVERRGYRGTIVTETGMREVAEMVRLRASIECTGLRRSVPDFPKEALERLEHFAVHMDRASAARDEYRLSELDRGFHLCVLNAARLPALEPIFLRCALSQHLYTYERKAERPSHHDCGADHRALITAIGGGDPVVAEEAMRAHIRQMVSIGAPQLLEY